MFEPDNLEYEAASIPMELTAGKLVDSDKVSVKMSVKDKRGKVYIKSVDLLTREREVAGRINKNKYLIPLHDIGQDEIKLIFDQSDSKHNSFSDNAIVIAKLLMPKENTDIVCGKVVKILDDYLETDTEINIVLTAFGISSRWDKAVLEEAENVANLPVSNYMQGRKDLRKIDFVTIDGEDAKDFDDAIFCESNADGWHIMVAIADVASYVAVNGILDNAAMDRGNSIYFPNHVVPMLPAVLSDNVCSLRPNTDRLALVCDLQLTAQGQIKNYQFFSAIIRSKARLTYAEVGKFFDTGTSLGANHPKNIQKMLLSAKKAFIQLLEQRKKRGALDLDSAETTVILNKRGEVSNIVRRTRNDAHRLIEEFMITANVCAAQFLAENSRLFPYRIHSGTKENIFDKYNHFFNRRGFAAETMRSQGIAELLSVVKGRDDRLAFRSIILRLLPKALYQANNIGHFGLALDSYTHFTSPIRRYSDLIVHRAIHHVIKSKVGVHYEKKDLDDINHHLCFTEQRAVEVSYDIQNFLKCRYAEKYIGQTFSGTISGVTSFGLFISLDEVYVEGLVHISQLGRDYYEFNESKQSLIGKRSKRHFTLGDSVRVTIAEVDSEGRKINLKLEKTKK